jgi:hypothetical protein
MLEHLRSVDTKMETIINFFKTHPQSLLELSKSNVCVCVHLKNTWFLISLAGVGVSEW